MAREKKYAQNVAAMVNAGATSTEETLTGTIKATGAEVSLDHPTKTYTLTDLSQALAFCDGDMSELLNLFASKVVNPMAQANDRRELAVLTEGPDKVIADLIKSFIKTGVADNETEAAETAVALMVKRGKVPAGYVYNA